MAELEKDAEDLLKSGKMANEVSINPALYSIAISLKRIADTIKTLKAEYKLAEAMEDVSHIFNKS